MRYLKTIRLLILSLPINTHMSNNLTLNETMIICLAVNRKKKRKKNYPLAVKIGKFSP